MAHQRWVTRSAAVPALIAVWVLAAPPPARAQNPPYQQQYQQSPPYQQYPPYRQQTPQPRYRYQLGTWGQPVFLGYRQMVQAPAMAAPPEFAGEETGPGRLSSRTSRRPSYVPPPPPPPPPVPVYGLMITSVVPNSAAARAGLEYGDIIKTADGREISSLDRLREAVTASDGTLHLIIRNVRTGQDQAMDVALGVVQDQ